MNKYEEAIKRLKGMIYTSPFTDERCDIDYNDLKICDTQLQNDFLKDLSILEELVDKATPKLPKGYIPLSKAVYYRCSVCNSPVGSNSKYCSKCGQRIDWGEDDANS